jgi:hypothetical protein
VRLAEPPRLHHPLTGHDFYLPAFDPAVEDRELRAGPLPALS